MPRVYAPVAFRWTDGLDYPFGYFEMPDDSKARAMNTAGKVYSGPGEAAAAQASVSGAGNARLAPNTLEFKSADGWTNLFGDASTMTYSTAGAFRAAQTMTFTPSAHPAGVKRTLSPTITIQSGAVIQVAFTLPESIADAGTPPNLTLKISSDGNATKSLAWTFQPSRFRTGGQQVVTVVAGETGTTDYDAGAWTLVGTEAWGNAFNYIHLSFGNLIGVPIQIDSIAIGVKDAPRIVWTFDNINDTSTLNVIAPSLAQYGWAAAVMMDSDQIAPNLSTINALRNTYGWEVGSMGGPGHINYKNTPGGGSAARLAQDLPLVYAAHSAAGLPRPTSFAYPANAHNAACDALLASEGFTWRRGNGVDILPNGGGNSIPLALGSLVRMGFSQPLGANYTAMKNRVDALCQGSGGDESMFTHLASTNAALVASPGGADLASWYQLVDYLGQMKRTYGLECIKPNEVASKRAAVRRF